MTAVLATFAAIEIALNEMEKTSAIMFYMISMKVEQNVICVKCKS